MAIVVLFLLTSSIRLRRKEQNNGTVYTKPPHIVHLCMCVIVIFHVIARLTLFVFARHLGCVSVERVEETNDKGDDEVTTVYMVDMKERSLESITQKIDVEL